MQHQIKQETEWYSGNSRWTARDWSWRWRHQSVLCLINIDESDKVKNESDENIAERDHETTEFEGEYPDNIRIMKGETIDALVKVTHIDMTARETLLKMKK